MMTFGPMIGASAIAPATFGGGSPIDLTFALLPFAWAAAGVVAVVLLSRRRRRETGRMSPRIVAGANRAPLAA